jgi:hypothetical protein
MERLHGTIRQRNKVMRGLDEESTAQTMMNGMRIYYNFIRPRMALNGSKRANRTLLSIIHSSLASFTCIQTSSPSLKETLNSDAHRNLAHARTRKTKNIRARLRGSSLPKTFRTKDAYCKLKFRGYKT